MSGAQLYIFALLYAEFNQDVEEQPKLNHISCDHVGQSVVVAVLQCFIRL
jgi:hypothetical protein